MVWRLVRLEWWDGCQGLFAGKSNRRTARSYRVYGVPVSDGDANPVGARLAREGASKTTITLAD
jgi:hypothetical protein